MKDILEENNLDSIFWLFGSPLKCFLLLRYYKGRPYICGQGLSPMSDEIQSCLYSFDSIAPVTEEYSELIRTSKTGFCENS